MAIILESSIKRYIGNSHDVRPKIGDLRIKDDGTTQAITTGDLPPGSTLYLTDLGIIERWNGTSWRRDPPDLSAEPIIDLLTGIKLELAALRLGMIGRAMCEEVSVDDASQFAIV